jgi:predicted nucleotidyltransferase
VFDGVLHDASRVWLSRFKGCGIVERSSVDNLRCDAAVRADIAAATSILDSSFGDALSGVILTGSAARGCFHRHSSDIDLLVVLAAGAVAGECAASVAQGLSGLSIPIDATVMTTVQLATDTWPTPICCLIKPPGRVVTKPEGSKDALLHRQDAFEAGRLIFKRAPVDIRPVPAPLVRLDLASYSRKEAERLVQCPGSSVAQTLLAIECPACSFAPWILTRIRSESWNSRFGMNGCRHESRDLAGEQDHVGSPRRDADTHFPTATSVWNLSRPGSDAGVDNAALEILWKGWSSVRLVAVGYGRFSRTT